MCVCAHPLGTLFILCKVLNPKQVPVVCEKGFARGRFKGSVGREHRNIGYNVADGTASVRVSACVRVCGSVRRGEVIF